MNDIKRAHETEGRTSTDNMQTRRLASHTSKQTNKRTNKRTELLGSNISLGLISLRAEVALPNRHEYFSSK